MEYVLDGLEAELELERELGVRAVEIDRALLSPPPAAAPTGRAGVPPPAADIRQPATDGERHAANREPPAARHEPPTDSIDFVFLHDRPLSPGGIEMMAKIVNAMGRTADTAPVIVAPPLPPARAYIVLGALALRKYFPEQILLIHWKFLKKRAYFPPSRKNDCPHPAVKFPAVLSGKCPSC